MWFDYLLSLFSLYLLVTLVAGAHVLLYKRNSRAAFGWLGLIVLFPIAGGLLYLLFGINRVQRKAQRVSGEVEGAAPPPDLGALRAAGARLSHPGQNVTGARLAPDNAVRTLFNGEQAFPAMLQAIDDARREVLVSSYIFDNDATGRRFCDRLAAARDRGCEVKVLVDDVGIRYSFPTIVRELRERRLEFRRFMPLRLLPPSFSINLRTHRKLLIADRQVAFAGGMNIGDRQLVNGPSPHRASDLHFRFSGPLLDDFVHLFADDWRFARGGELPAWRARHVPQGAARCRLVPDGPDEHLDALMLVKMGVISSARERVWIMTPYFLPDRQMLGCLQAVALSGVDVQVMIPGRNNWPLVQWALQHTMAELLDTGVRILQQPPPFAHSKCMVIDDSYCLVGSSNFDPRSLRLNFELGIEVFDHGLNRQLAEHFAALARNCERYTRERLDGRSLPARLRDGASALFSPYL